MVARGRPSRPTTSSIGRLAESGARLVRLWLLGDGRAGLVEDADGPAGLDARFLPDMDAALAILGEVRREIGIPVLTDVHTESEIAAAAQVVDVLQIPAFLCRQTDLLVAAGRTGRPVNVKKGQWMAPEGMRGAVDKLRAAGAPEVAVTERGTFFGYGDLVVDMRSFARLRAACAAPVVFDATHAVQQPGQGTDGTSGGQRAFVPPLLHAAAAAGADAFFLETHPDPDRAPSDGPNMLPLDRLADVLAVALDIWHRVRETARV